MSKLDYQSDLPSVPVECKAEEKVAFAFAAMSALAALVGYFGAGVTVHLLNLLFNLVTILSWLLALACIIIASVAITKSRGKFGIFPFILGAAILIASVLGRFAIQFSGFGNIH